MVILKMASGEFVKIYIFSVIYLNVLTRVAVSFLQTFNVVSLCSHNQAYRAYVIDSTMLCF